ncbi:hypothetical protein [Clostridium sp. 001]|uniref:hypothetical protein n=1 Tax=Clostridium sp. 001 TaxID=1970093 RepID=UPI001C2C38D4|nr:hypothetical protein [Clostridium sp. 001]QXE20009.1 hypothetical protein B5S50_14915 [Clostridium sp. 001]
MENLMKEISDLKEKLRLMKEDRDELKAVLHIVTVHCCHLIGEKEGKKVEDVYTEINQNINTLIHSSNI